MSRLTFFFFCLLGTTAFAAPPVRFAFSVEATPSNPFARDIWADVVLPEGRTLRLPVYFAGGDRYEVRARAIAAGEYRLARIVERHAGAEQDLPLPSAPRRVQRVKTPATLRGVELSRGDSPGFIFADGTVFTPIGANIPWTPTHSLRFYRGALRSFSEQQLNWARIWMAHWGRLNLDWVQAGHGRSPPPGALDLEVAESLDELIERAEAEGVYVQLVLQHHGQYTTGANSNWAFNPWNAANPGGFLPTTSDFFTAPRARELTAMKYRYIVARWGYSPAIMAWELFNEVHWTNALHDDKNSAIVAQWHAEMAAVLRSVDVYRHLLTTSLEELHSPIYDAMDYLQPHLYAPAMLSTVRRLPERKAGEDRPMFYGEIGDDHMTLAPRVKEAGLAIVPPVWAGLMGESRIPPQVWLGNDLVTQKKLPQLGAVARFLEATQLGARRDLQPCVAQVACATRVPFTLTPEQTWQRRAVPVLEIPGDGRERSGRGEMPQVLVGAKESLDDGFPGRVTIRIELPQATTATLRVSEVGKEGAILRVTVNGVVVAEERWASLVPPAEASAPVAVEKPASVEKPEPRPRVLTLSLPAGAQELALENVGGADWMKIAELDFGYAIPALAAVGKRSADFLAFWVWRRDGVFALDAPPAVAGELVEDLPAGKWMVTWWDSLAGVPHAPQVVDHPGGTFRLGTPAISRHAAVAMEKLPVAR